MPRESLGRPAAFDQHYGLEDLRAGGEEATARLAIGPHHLQPTGVVHGGVYAAIAEAVASFGTNATVGGDGNVALGMTNATSFLRPAASGTLHARGRARHRGRTSWVWDVDIADDDGRLCATGRVTLAVRPLPGRDETPTDI
ncbi:MAG TPA: PaaI family thioesterase [Baekduia sp.]|nr:PaaI family thioesterase [Baekduia sp.]